MTTRSRRAPHPLVTLLGLAALLVIVAVAMVPVGFCLGWVGDLIWSATP